jgi:hypothetical protein
MAMVNTNRRIVTALTILIVIGSTAVVGRTAAAGRRRGRRARAPRTGYVVE